MTTLKDKTISGMFWSLMQNVGGKGITFLVTIVLARFLTPRDFGLVGMLTIFILISQTLVAGGFNQALIREKKIQQGDYSSVFFINLLVSIVLYLILFFLAPYVALFYNQPELIKLTRGLSLVFIINAFSYVQEARLVKQMQFRKLMLVGLPSTVIGGVTSIVMAVNGYGVWALVALQIVTRTAYAIQIWINSGWIPRFVFNKNRIRFLFSFGSKLALSGVINTVYQNIYLVILGKFFSVSSVGYYQNANNVVQYPIGTFSTALNKVTYPAFALIQDDNAKLRDSCRRIIQQILLWICPLIAIGEILAEPFFRFLFTEKWLPSVPYFRWLCIVGIFLPLNSYNLNIVNVKGRSDLFLKIEIIKKVFISIGLIIVVPLGVEAVLIFQAFNALFAYAVNSYYSGRFIEYSFLTQLKDIAPTFVLGFATSALVYVADSLFLINQSDGVRLISGFILGMSFYLFMAKQLRFSSLTDFVNIVRNKLMKQAVL